MKIYWRALRGAPSGGPPISRGSNLKEENKKTFLIYVSFQLLNTFCTLLRRSNLSISATPSFLRYNSTFFVHNLMKNDVIIRFIGITWNYIVFRITIFQNVEEKKKHVVFAVFRENNIFENIF